MAWNTQRNWRWCSKCQGLWFGGNAGSKCPAGGTHTKVGSANYSLVMNATGIPGQPNWRWCNKCQGLWFGGNPAGKCPEGGNHVKVGSANYTLANNSGAGQTNWRWCSKCQGLWFGGNPAGPCPNGGKHVKTGSADYRLIQVTTTVRVHVKILTIPNVSLETMLNNMREVYAVGKIDVECASSETLNLPALNDVDVGTCVSGVTTTEQNQLFANRNNVGTNELVVYMVRSTLPPFNGCAAHPAGRPGAVVAKGASQWTFGHELGHVLGLNHVNNNDRLMTRNGTANITNPPPDLATTEVTTMVASPFTINV